MYNNLEREKKRRKKVTSIASLQKTISILEKDDKIKVITSKSFYKRIIFHTVGFDLQMSQFCLSDE
ncbi:unnamed protein product [Musa hybrid cultivar]